jgi:glycine cleavage system protein P-like pyridoxal-binding family
VSAAATLYPEAVDDVLMIECLESASREERLEAWGRIIKNGMHRVLQGSYGRTAAALIAAGVIGEDGTVYGE